MRFIARNSSSSSFIFLTILHVFNAAADVLTLCFAFEKTATQNTRCDDVVVVDGTHFFSSLNCVVTFFF